MEYVMNRWTHKGNLRYLFILVVLYLSGIQPVLPQEVNITTESAVIAIGDIEYQLNYDETVGSRFEASNPQVQQWQFAAKEREMLRVTVRRTSGIFTPKIRLVANGQEIVTVEESSDAWTQVIRVDDGLPTSGNYTIEVTPINIVPNDLLPLEYSLTLEYLGQRRIDSNEGLSPYPTTITGDQFPQLTTGSSAFDDSLGVSIYGGGQVSQPDRAMRISVYQINAGAQQIELNNGSPISRGISSFSFSPAGIGFVDAINGAQFFTDQNIAALEFAQSLATITLTNGQMIVTDFYRIKYLQAVDNFVIITTTLDQHLVFSGATFDFRRQGGVQGEGPSIEPINVFKIDDKQIKSDLDDWHTLIYAPTQGEPLLRVLYGNDFRIRSAFANVSIEKRGNSERSELDEEGLDTHYVDWEIKTGDESVIILNADPFRFGEVLLNSDNTMTVTGLDGRVIQEPLNTLKSLLIENEGILFTRLDNSYYLSLPDGTLDGTTVDMPMPSSDGVVFPQNYNNLGTRIVDYRPTLELQGLDGVNRANGNLMYQVTDFDVPSHAIALNLSRTYNSRWSLYDAPAYFDRQIPAYSPVRFGAGWRHSMQYELDIRYALNGEVRLVLPDGSIHRFAQSAPNVYTSPTLMSWIVERQSGITGAWKIVNGDGDIYSFDRAGRLQSIEDFNGHRLNISPMPRYLLSERDATGGILLTESYGRRFEIYTDSDYQITLSRDVQGREITYTYSNGNLVNVQYPGASSTANYEYNGGFLVKILDPRSPIHQDMALSYQSDGRVEQWQIGAGSSGGKSRVRNFVYNNLQTTETETINGKLRTTIWEFDTLIRLAVHQLPKEGWSYRFTYEGESFNIQQFRQPSSSIISVDLNEQGYVRQIRNVGVTDYILTLSSPNGYLQQVDEIAFPQANGQQLKYTLLYDELHRLNMISYPIRIGQTTITHTTAYTYDEWGRTASITEPVDNERNSVAQYIYDEFGYVSRIDYDNGGRTLLYEHDMAGRLLQFTDGRGTVTTFVWDVARNLITRIEIDDFVYNFQYDEWGNLTQRQIANQTEEYLYNNLNQVIIYTDAAGRIVSYEYDEIGNLLHMTLPDGTAQQYTYDALDHLTSMTDRNGQTTQYKTEVDIESTKYYDEVIAPNGERTRYLYNAYHQLENITIYDTEDVRTYTYGFLYNPLGHMTEVTEFHRPDARTLKLAYDLRGLPLSMSLDGIETLFTYNLAGNLTSVTDADGFTTQFNYDLYHNVVAITKPSGIQETYAYDERDNLIQFINGNGYEYQFTYDSLGRLTDQVDPLNHLTTYGYDANGFLTTVTDARDNVTEITYDDAGRVVSDTDANGNTNTYEYDLLDRLTQVTEPSGLNTQFTYDRSDNLIAVTQPGNREQLFSYDSFGRLTARTNALGYTTQYLYNNYNRLGRLIDPLGNTDRFVWYGSGQLWKAFGPTGSQYEYVTDPIGRLQKIVTSGSAQNSNVVFDTRIEYSDGGRIEALKFTNNVDNYAYEFGYDADGLLTSYKSPLTKGLDWQYTYDAIGNVETVTSPTGVRTSYTYDEVGNIVEVVRAVGVPEQTIETFGYDAVGNVTQYIAPDGIVSDFVLDERNLIKERTDTNPQGEQRIFRYEYDLGGNLILYIGPDGTTVEYLYDLFGNLTNIRRIRGEEVVEYRYEYDSLNRLSSIVLPEQETINITYNALNQPVRYVKASDTVWGYGYDSEGNLTRISDALGSSTVFTYDEQNRVTQITYPNGTSAHIRYESSGKTQWRGAEKEEDNINSIEIVTYTLDAEGNLTNIQHDTQEQYAFTRDALGRVESTTDPKKQTIRYQYDAYNRITGITAMDTNVRRTYENGNVKQIADENETITLTYDAWNNLTQYQSNDITASYEYDINGRLISRNLGDLGTYTYQYDDLGLPVQLDVDGTVASFQYNNNGWLTGIALDNGLMQRFNYNPDGLITSVSYQQESNGIDRFAYVYDAVGNLTRVTRLDDWSVLYSYDSAHQLVGERWLTAVNEEVYSMIIGYDTVGNRVEDVLREQQHSPERTLYEYNVKNQLMQETPNVPFQVENRMSFGVIAVGLALLSVIGYPRLRPIFPIALFVCLLMVGLVMFGYPEQTTAQNNDLPINYTYDPNGNLIRLQHEEGAAIEYQYDSFNRVTHIQGHAEDGSTIDTSVTYDVLGRIHSLKIGTESIRFIYDAYGLVGIQGSETTERVILRPFDSKVLWYGTSSGTQYPLYDAQHFVRKIVDQTGNIVGDPNGTQFTAYGQIVTPYQQDGEAIDNVTALPFLYWDGAIYDPTSDYYILGARLYDPKRGRFVQRDPIRHDPINTLYTYANNRPTVLRDPLGLHPVTPIEHLDVRVNPKINTQQYVMIPQIDHVMDNPSVASSQMQEVVRFVDIASRNTFVMNEPALRLDENGCDLYIANANPQTSNTVDPMYLRTIQNMSLFNGESWQPTTLAIPAFSPTDTLNLAQQALSNVQSSNHILQHDGCRDMRIVPEIELDHVQTEPMAGYTEITDQLSDVPMYPALKNDMLTFGLLPADMAYTPITTNTKLQQSQFVMPLDHSEVLFGEMVNQMNVFYQSSFMPYVELQGTVRPVFSGG